jgi:hypothetical protein
VNLPRRKAAFNIRALRLWLKAAIGLLFAIPGPAYATYTAPLVRVLIDRDLVDQTPSVAYTTSSIDDDTKSTELIFTGAQYILQAEWAGGYGFQAGLGVGQAEARLALPSRGLSFSGTGLLLGGQLRAYAMVADGTIVDWTSRRSALTGFANVRAIHYSAGSDSAGFQAENTTISGGVGAMAELALMPWLSICPYAWFSPSLYGTSKYSLGAAASPIETSTGWSLRQPIRVGIDAWIYPLGDGSEDHFSLSAITSLIDTSGHGSRETSIVLGFTF